MYRPKLLRFDRLRSLERPYSWVPFRLLSSGLLAQLSQPAKLLYFFLCLVADRRGMSFYSDRRVHELLELSDQQLSCGRSELCDRDLLAFDGRVYQLLSWPTELARCGGAAAEASPDLPQAKSPTERAGPQQLLAVLQHLHPKER